LPSGFSARLDRAQPFRDARRMSFPHDDPAWESTAAFLKAHLAPEHRIVAPDPFRFVIPRAIRFTQLGGHPPGAVQWTVVHKGELGRVPRRFLEALPREAVPVFANPVFVVFATAPPAGLTDLSATDDVRALCEGIAALAPEPPLAARLLLREPPLRRWLMRGETGERAFRSELEGVVADYLGPAEELALLDIGCGGGGLAELLPGAARIAGVDIDADAIARAKARHGALPGRDFLVMDAAKLRFEDASFDAAVMLDVLDEMEDALALLAEASRVLARGGRLVATATNSESLPLKALRRLGHAVPAGGLSVNALTGMLRAVGLTPLRLDGILFSPGWSAPGASSALAPLEDEPDFIETMRVLGRRCGPEHALAMAVLARKG
jgi:SAM-dependent methyltransferase